MLLCKQMSISLVPAPEWLEYFLQFWSVVLLQLTTFLFYFDFSTNIKITQYTTTTIWQILAIHAH